MQLVLDLTQRMAFIGLTAFVLMRVRPFRRLLAGAGRPRDRLMLALIFGVVSIFGTYMGIPIQGALANSRVIGAAAGGLLGGPWVGLAAGLIGGTHRYLLGGFTALSCGLSTLVEGLLAGWICRRVGQQRLDWRVGFVTGLVAEALQMIIILLVSRPFADAWALVQVIAVPMTLVNASGLALFLLIIKEGVDQEDRLVCFYTHKVLEVARDTLPFLRRGLDPQSAQEVARLIQTRTGAAAVALTDQTGVLAHVGIGADHHRPGDPIRTAATRQALTEGLPQVAAGAHEIGCEIKGCPLGSGVVVPLVVRGQVVGTLKLYQPKNTPVSPPLVEQATGMAGLFSTQLELADLERQAQMATRAELKALRAQINPHFLFNALNTISSFVRTDPDGARNLLAHLSDFFRRTLRSSEELVTVAEELELVESYLTIELARFGPRLRVETNVAPALLRCPIPPFTLQPLVENAVKHGLLPRSTGGTIRLTGRMDGGAAVLTVADDGDGMDPGVAAGALVGRSSGRGIGLINVNERLKGHFGPDAGLSIHTARGAGTTITLRLPAPVVISRAAASTKEV